MSKLICVFLSLFLGSKSFAWDIPFKDSLMRTPGEFELFRLFNWGIQSICYLLFIFLILAAANRFSKEKYSTGLASFIAAIVAGTAPYLARSLT